MRKRIIPIIVICLLLAGAFGVYAFAATGAGTESDPLVTLSYLNSVLTKLKSDTESELDAKLTEIETELAGQSPVNVGTSGGVSEYEVVTLTAGQTLTGGVGTEIILRIGSVKCYASSSPGLIDTTDGNTIDNGSALSKNHLYMVTIDGRGVKASERATLVIKGSYSIS